MFKKIFGTILCFYSSFLLAAGVVPQASIVIVESAEGEAVIDVENTDNFPVLLITKIEDLEDDTEELVAVLPPVARVEGNGIQTIRFIVTAAKPITEERLKRVTFEGVPPRDGSAENQVRVSFRQNLPLLIRPAGLAKDLEPWRHLTWHINQGNLVLKNNSPYIVRFISTEVAILPSMQKYNLPHHYILPHKSFTLESNKSLSSIGNQQVQFLPATTWGFSTDKPYTSKLLTTP